MRSFFLFTSIFLIGTGDHVLGSERPNKDLKNTLVGMLDQVEGIDMTLNELMSGDVERDESFRSEAEKDLGPVREEVNYQEDNANGVTEVGYDEASEEDSNGDVSVYMNLPVLPGIEGSKFGYNIYKGDPLFILDSTKDGTRDPGIGENEFFFISYNPTTGNNIINLGGTEYRVPAGYSVKRQRVHHKKSSTTSIESSEAFKTSSSAYANVGGSGSFRGVNFGGNVGVSASNELSKRSSSSEITTCTHAQESVYEFTLENNPDAVILSDYAMIFLSNLYNNMLDEELWAEFFDKYGTHVITKGVFGAWMKMTMKFSQYESEKIAKTSWSFEAAMSVGIPGLFSVDRSIGADKNSEETKAIKNTRADRREYGVGNFTDPLEDGDLIKRDLSNICEYLPPNLNVNVCIQMMEKYCISKLSLYLNNPSSCDVYNKFECTHDGHCGSGRVCSKGQCINESSIKWIVTPYTSCNTGCQKKGKRCIEVRTSNINQLKKRTSALGKVKDPDYPHYGYYPSYNRYFSSYTTYAKKANPSAQRYKLDYGVGGVFYLGFALGTEMPSCDASSLSKWLLCSCV